MEGNQRWFVIDHKGHEIVFSDFTNMEGQEFVEQIIMNDEFSVQAGKQAKEKLLFLADVTESWANKEVIAKFRDTVKKIAPYTQASAVVGVEGIKKHVLNFVNVAAPFKSRAFSDIDEAKDWLVQQANSR